MAEWERKRYLMRCYDHTAGIYEARYREEQALKIQLILRKSDQGNDKFIADLGCGTGLLIPTVLRRANRVVGLDISREMLRQGDYPRKGSEKVDFVLADSDYLPLRSGLFDMIFIVTLLQNLPTPLRTLKEASRIAKLSCTIAVTGLKVQFDRKAFVDMLKKAELNPSLLKRENAVKCHIALCRKRPLSPSHT